MKLLYSQNINISFVLVETKYSGNLGLCARAIKNFGFTKLVLVNPLCKIDNEARYRAMHAQDILDNIKIFNTMDEFIEKEKPTTIIGTTARIGSESNPLRIAISLESIRNATIPYDTHISILFGNEERGLKNIDLEKCDFVITIPASGIYPTLNLSHAVAIVAYEFSLAVKTFRELPYRAANRTEKNILIETFNNILNVVYPDMPEPRKEIYRGIIRNFICRAFLSGREAHSLIGFAKKILKFLCAKNCDTSD